MQLNNKNPSNKIQVKSPAEMREAEQRDQREVK